MNVPINKRALHHAWTLIRPIKPWYFLAASLVVAVVCIGALRSNYQTMVRLRQAVYAADAQADTQNGNVEQALQQLRAFVSQHMNTNLATADGVYPPIQLVHTYERLVQAEQARANAANSQVYTAAQAQCEARFPGGLSGRSRIPCIEEYVKANGITAKKIPADLYKFDFVSPRWSPDLAGWSMVLATILLALALLRFGAGWVLKHLTR